MCVHAGMEAINSASMLLSALGTLAAGAGVLMIGLKSETLAQKMASEGLSEGLKGHMSAPDAGRQFGQAAFDAFKAKVEQQHFFGNPRRSVISVPVTATCSVPDTALHVIAIYGGYI